ncbi:MAG: hypothetical protein EPO08_18515 [Rhodospirillaceae bacterium]|nr:MAG: hypothetical protein EPO08_18515 [Rhodospirillaceae bacterium]
MKKPWFRPRRYGYGSGFPVSWEGWAVLAIYMGALFGIRFLVRGSPLMILAVIPLTGLLLWICRARTEGGWRWRWGEDN